MAELYQDLLKDTSKSFEDGNYFLVTITDLNPNTTYPLQFRWTYKDGSVNDSWSAVKLVTTPGESEPNTPKFVDGNVDVSQPEKIIITWDGTSDDSTNLANYDRVDVYIDGAPFDGTKAAYSFKAPGTTIIPAPAGTYQIVLYAVSKTGTLSPVSSAVTKTVTGAGTSVTSPEDPDTPTIKAGLASVIVSWNGKKSGGGDLTTTGFAGAKVYIGTSSNFTPSDNNWVHTLNFANGSNQVSIGVGTVIDKNAGTTLTYGTPYYIKLGTLNASGQTTGNYIASNPTNITVSKLPASEISTGILSADAYITAGAESGARVVLGGSSEPFIIYGTDGTTKLLDFIGGSTGTLSITGSGNFSGNLSIGSGNSIFKAEPATGIWLGDSTFSAADFRVSTNGVLRARSGTIGGWTLGSTYLQGTNLKLDTSGITVGATTSSYFDISPTALTHRNSNGTASGKFTLTLGASPQLTIDGTITVGGSAVATSGDLSTGLAGKVSNGGVSGDSSFTANNIVYKINGNTNTTTIDGGKITTGTVEAGSVVSTWVYAGNISANQINAGSLSANYLSGGTITGIEFNNGSGTFLVTAAGALTASSATITGALNADSGRIGDSVNGWTITSDGTLYNGSTYLFPSSGVSNANGVSYVLYTNRGLYTSSTLGFTAGGTNLVSYRGSSPHISSSAAVRINDSFAPNSDNAYSLGFTDARWQIVRSAGGVSTTSDQRLKTNIEDSELGLNFINLLRPVSYKMISGGKIYKDNEEKTIVDGEIVEPELIDRPGIRTHWGFLAQNVKEAIDTLGVEDFAGWQLDNKDDPNSGQSLVHHEFLGPIVKAIQELSARLDALEA